MFSTVYMHNYLLNSKSIMHDKPFMVFVTSTSSIPVFMPIIRLIFYITLKKQQYRNDSNYGDRVEYRAI